MGSHIPDCEFAILREKRKPDDSPSSTNKYTSKKLQMAAPALFSELFEHNSINAIFVHVTIMYFLRTTEFAFFMRYQRCQIHSDCLHFLILFLQTFHNWVVPCASWYLAKVEKNPKKLAIHNIFGIFKFNS